MYRLHNACLLLAISLVLPAAAHATCKDNAVCVDEFRNGTDVELRARNLKNFPITYTLSVRSTSYSLKGPDTVTQTLGPGEAHEAMRLDSDNSDQGGDEGYLRYALRWSVGNMDARHDDDYVYALPYGVDRSYRVLQGYGSRFSHTGREEFSVDFDMRIGTPVHAARAGVVAKLEESHSKGCWDRECAAHANFIVILHDDGTTGEYYHLARNGALVDLGETVSRGQRIGLSGNTGHTTMPHLHFGVYRAIAWGKTQSIPVRFQSADGIINRPRRGGRYQASLE